MAIEFRCGQCSQLLRVPDTSAGKNARCPKCQALMQVPAAGGSDAVAPPPFPSAPAAGPPPPPPEPPAPSDDPFEFLKEPGSSPPPAPGPLAAFSERGAGTPGHDPLGRLPLSADPYASPSAAPGYAPPSGHNPAAMILAACSLVTALMGLLSCACCLFVPFPAISLVLGVIALLVKPDPNARIIAIIGIVLSVLVLVLIVVAMVFWGVSLSLDPEFQRAMQEAQ